MKLGIYEHGRRVNAYEADAYDLTFGTVEDVLGALQLDNVQLTNDTELVKLAVRFVGENMPLVKDLLKDIFEGITDEDIRKTKVKEVGVVLVEVVRYAFKEIQKGVSEKN